MTNLLTVLPEFDVKPYTHLLPSLEKALISTADLLTLDAIEVGKRASLPTGELKKLSEALLEALHSGIDISKRYESSYDGGKLDESCSLSCGTISTLDGRLDAILGGGITSGYLTEIVGER